MLVFLLLHSACYGIVKSQIENETCLDKQNDREDWFCDKCSYLQTLPENEYIKMDTTSCCLCGMHGGAMKRTTCGQWSHIVCAIAYPEVEFVDKIKRGPIDIKLLNPARRKLVRFLVFNLKF